MPDRTSPGIKKQRCRVAVIWIDWYPYHVARFRGLVEALPGEVEGIELVGGTGVHAGLKFREELPVDLPIRTLLPGESWGTASHVQLARMLWRRLSEVDPEVVLVPGYYTLPALAAALWARVHGRTSVLMTESTAGDHRRSWWRETIKSLGLRALFGWAVAGGKAHVEYLRRLNFPAARVTGFYDVVDNDFFQEGTRALRQRSPADFELPVSRFFLYVGRLAPEKNVKTLLQSWLTYRAAGGMWPLVLVGDGAEMEALKRVAAASPFPAEVHFAGLRSSRELLPFYNFAGCFVIPSTREPWGLVVNEAMAAKLPVLVSSRCGCAPDLVVQGHNGFLFEPLDTSGLIALLHEVEMLAPEELRRMGAASAEIIASFTPAQFGSSVVSIASYGLTAGDDQRALEAVPGGPR